jgi:hypothetical protein
LAGIHSVKPAPSRFGDGHDGSDGCREDSNEPLFRHILVLQPVQAGALQETDPTPQDGSLCGGDAAQTEADGEARYDV